MGQRVVATTAVRCVGNTLLLHGAVYSPPFVVRALGDPTRLTAALDDAASVQIFRQYVSAYGLVYRTTTERALRLPPYSGSVEVDVRPLPENRIHREPDPPGRTGENHSMIAPRRTGARIPG